MSSEGVDADGSQSRGDDEEWSDGDASFGCGSGGEDDIRCQVRTPRPAQFVLNVLLSDDWRVVEWPGRSPSLCGTVAQKLFRPFLLHSSFRFFRAAALRCPPPLMRDED